MAFPEGADKDGTPTELDRLRVAMAVQIAREIADADGILDVGEVEVMARTFPTDWLDKCGFLDDRGHLNQDAAVWYERARKELPHRLELKQKLEMITVFHRMCMADDEMHEAELSLLTNAARRLHIPIAAFRKHLRAIGAPESQLPPKAS